MTTVLIVEDDDSSREGLVAALQDSGNHEILSAASGEEAVARLRLSPVDVVISDVMMGRIGGLDLLKHIQSNYPDTAVILMTAYGSIESAVQAMRGGAYDYVTKPIDLDRLDLVLARALRQQNLVVENRSLKRELERQRVGVPGIIGRSAAMRAVLERVEQIAATNATVLITGESGTGKELIAKAIHQQSTRRDQRMVSVNCAALPEGVVESELFGHEKGAFTGAHQQRKGRFELAHRGTLFLDELGDLSLPIQVKLLRVLQEREVERVGAQHPVPIDVRLVAATNQALEQLIADGAFREDLYYRLRVVTIDIPPLRERPEDIPLLLEHFRKAFVAEHNKQIKGYSDAAFKAMTRYAWPGNVRELQNTVESLVVTATSDMITVQQLPDSIMPNREQLSVQVPTGKSLADIERMYILKTLELLDGNKSRAARVLGIGKKTLYRRLHEFGMIGTQQQSHAN